MILRYNFCQGYCNTYAGGLPGAPKAPKAPKAPGLIPLRSIAPLRLQFASFNAFASFACHCRGAMERSGISPGAPGNSLPFPGLLHL
jgi:hypothetical protein